MTDLDKLSTTPIPTAYTFHLRLTVWAYLFFLPFQLYQYLGWLTIPATTVAAITYLGFLEIGAQVCLRSKLYEKLKEGNWKIQMPFAYDQSDLDLDGFVGKLSRQLAQVTAVSLRHLYTESRCNFQAVPIQYAKLSNRPIKPESTFSSDTQHDCTRNSRHPSAGPPGNDNGLCRRLSHSKRVSNSTYISEIPRKVC
jgi:hypothetical protein